MLYRTLPGTDLSISVVGMGCWSIGRKYWGDDVRDDVSVEAIHAALDEGINWFDTAPLYGDGHSDEILRRALAGLQDPPLIATKVGVLNPGPSGHAESQLTAEHLSADLAASLKRLDLEVIDLLQVHWPCQHGTPLEETFEALAGLKRAGLVRHVGVCNYPPDQLARICDITEIVSLQTPISLLRREFEGGLRHICQQEGLGVLAYEPLCRGLLSGKYSAEPTFPDSDMRSRDDRFRGRWFKHGQGVSGDLGKLGRRLGVATSAVAIGWVCALSGVTAAIAGAKTPQQVRDNAEAWRFVESPEAIEVVEKILHRHRHTRP